MCLKENLSKGVRPSCHYFMKGSGLKQTYCFAMSQLKRYNLSRDVFYSQPAPEDMLTGTVSDSANKRENKRKYVRVFVCFLNYIRV